MLKFRNEQVMMNILLFVCFVCLLHLHLKEPLAGTKTSGSTFYTDGMKEIVVGENVVTSPPRSEGLQAFSLLMLQGRKVVATE
jgi:hypothetical protein